MNCVGDVSGLFWSPQFQVLKEIRSFAAPKIGQDCICQPPTSRCDRVHREGYCTPQKSPWLILSPKRWLCLGDQCRTLAKTAFKYGRCCCSHIQLGWSTRKLWEIPGEICQFSCLGITWKLRRRPRTWIGPPAILTLYLRWIFLRNKFLWTAVVASTYKSYYFKIYVYVYYCII